jgi:hypothetical protein
VRECKEQWEQGGRGLKRKVSQRGKVRRKRSLKDGSKGGSKKRFKGGEKVSGGIGKGQKGGGVRRRGGGKKGREFFATKKEKRGGRRVKRGESRLRFERE